VNDDTAAISLSAFADGELDTAKAQDLGGQLSTDAGLRRVVGAYKALDAAAARLPVPDLAGKKPAAAKAWRNVARQTTAVSAADRRAFARLEGVAAALPAPAVSDEAFEQTWNGIARRLQVEAPALRRRASGIRVALAEAQAPEPSARKWDEVWRGIHVRTRRRERSASPLTFTETSEERAREVVRPLAPWRWLAAASLAAAVLLGLLAYVPFQRAEQGMSEAPEVPEVLDDRYQAHIEYTEGQRSPVVCFLLKDDTGLGGEKGHNWSWLPE